MRPDWWNWEQTAQRWDRQIDDPPDTIDGFRSRDPVGPGSFSLLGDNQLPGVYDLQIELDQGTRTVSRQSSKSGKSSSRTAKGWDHRQVTSHKLFQS